MSFPHPPSPERGTRMNAASSRSARSYATRLGKELRAMKGIKAAREEFLG
jgi:hypothetical protein